MLEGRSFQTTFSCGIDALFPQFCIAVEIYISLYISIPEPLIFNFFKLFCHEIFTLLLLKLTLRNFMHFSKLKTFQYT